MRRRFVSITAVALLHVAIFIALLHAIVVAPLERRTQPEHEVTLILPQIGQASRAPHKGVERRGTATLPSDLKSPFVSPMPQAGAIGQALFDCSLDHLGDLSPEERAKCSRMTGLNYAAFAAQPLKLPPLPEKLRNSDIAARQRNTADPCLIAKQSGTECIHELLFGKGLP